jgi:hypothetical protein
MEHGRMKIRIIGGIRENEATPLEDRKDQSTVLSSAADGIKFITDFSVGSITLNNDTKVNEVNTGCSQLPSCPSIIFTLTFVATPLPRHR